MDKSTTDKLLHSIRNNDLIGCEDAIQQGAELNTCDANDLYPLDWAFYCKNKNIVKLLRQNGAFRYDAHKIVYLSRKDSNLLLKFIKYDMGINSLVTNSDVPLLSVLLMHGNNNDLIEILLKNGADPNVSSLFSGTPLKVAIDAVNEVIVKLLLQYGARINNVCVNHKTPLINALMRMSCNINITEILLQNGADPNLADADGKHPLYFVRYNEMKKISKLLIKYGANIDCLLSNNKEYLLNALKYGNNYLAKLLLEKNNTNINEVDEGGNTLLHRTSGYINAQDSMKLLLDHGADPNIKNINMQTPLHIAANIGNFSSVSILLKYGADANIQDEDGATPLYLCVNRRGDSNVYKNFIDNGANPDIVNSSGISPLHLVIERGDHITMKLFYTVRKTRHKISLFLTQAHEFDENSLFYKNYFCYDLFRHLLKSTFG